MIRDQWLTVMPGCLLTISNWLAIFTNMKLTDWHAKIKSLVPGRCVWQAHVQLLSDIQANVVRFLADDALHGGRCERVWTGLLHLAFDEFRDLDLCTMILQLCGRCFFNRENAAERPALLDFIEYCSGLGNLTKALLRKQMHGACFDYLYSPNHNMLTKEGLRLFIEALAAARTNCLCWFGTACSSFVRLCSSQSCRRPENGYYGDESRPWVFSGNCMSDISSLLFFFGFVHWLHPSLRATHDVMHGAHRLLGSSHSLWTALPNFDLHGSIWWAFGEAYHSFPPSTDLWGIEAPQAWLVHRVTHHTQRWAVDREEGCPGGIRLVHKGIWWECGLYFCRLSVTLSPLQQWISLSPMLIGAWFVSN